MPTFRTAPDPDNTTRSPYDDLNRIERNDDRHLDRNAARADDRNAADLRAQDRLERVLDPNGREVERNSAQRPELNHRDADLQAKAVQQTSRKNADAADPLIQGLFSKLPAPSTEWPLPARQKWLQTAANIFDLMYVQGEADAGEVAIRVERTSAR